MIRISFELVPMTHIVFMVLCWASMIVYVRLLYIIKTTSKEYRSTFFRIVKIHAFTDISMFLLVEFIARPRKYRIHNLLFPISDNWLPQTIYFCQTWIKNTMFMGYVVVAINRLTVVVNTKRHNNIWTPTIIYLIYLFEWLAPSTALIPMFYGSGNHNFSFIASSNGGLSLRANSDFMKTISRPNTIFMTSNGSKRRFCSDSVPSTEIIILKCAFFSFVFFIPNAIKTIILYTATDPQIVNIATDLWYFTTELMCISSPWSLLLGSKRLREKLIPEVNLKVSQSSTGTFSGTP